MLAAVIDTFGDSDEFKVRDVPSPAIGDRQVLLLVKAAGLNPLDCRIRRGELRGFVRSRMPLILGNDVSGVVERVGSNVTRFAVGDEVISFIDSNERPTCTGFAQPGGYATYAVTREDTLAHKPVSMSHVQAATLPLASLTAHQALVQLAAIQKGDRVLINGASGGVGQFATQIAKMFGATVTASCGPDSESFVRELGADTCLSYHDLSSARADRFDVIYDVAAKLNYSDWAASLTRKGRFISNLVSVHGVVSDVTAPLLRWFGAPRRYDYTWVRPSGQTLEKISNWADRHLLRTAIDGVYSLWRVPEAHRRLEAGRVRGKIVLDLTLPRDDTGDPADTRARSPRSDAP